MEESYKNLSLEEKRNELNKETLKLLYLVNQIVNDSKADYFNYDSSMNISEENFLFEEYLQIKEITDKLIGVFK